MTVKTFTITSASDRRGTYSLISVVWESAGSAERHVQAMSEAMGFEPVYQATRVGSRWTWEYVNEVGTRCSDTVRVVR